MDEEAVECTRCGATFESQDELMVHSIDVHAGVEPPEADGASDETRATDDATDDTPAAASPVAGTDVAATDGRATDQRGDGGTAVTGELDPATVDRLTTILEERSASDLTVNYRQRFLAAASVGILVVALALSYLHLTGVLDTAVYMFALGTLFGLTLSYLQAFLRTLRG